MADMISVACPECRKFLKASADLLGKKIRCKACGHIFTAKTIPPKTVAVKTKGGKPPASKAKVQPEEERVKRPFDEDEDEDGNPYGVTTLDLSPRSPNCANEMEDEEAIICLTCGYNTQTRMQAATRKVHETTFGDYALWLLPGILCVLYIIGQITFDIVYCLMINDWVDPEQWYAFIGSNGVKLWMCIISIAFMWAAGKFAFRRLILNYNPPEIEKKK
jgi:DNA-directed RNA polymerase subunit M/transcription elongation factor TFIIS